ncbi:SPOC like C-terminal domain-containing protein [Spinellus fusiger]|nr:SPOC like C-terminal domain-containing protein [Spinellus fusiger]
MTDKKATIYILDTTQPWDTKSTEGALGPFNKARQIVRKHIERKLLAGRKTDMTGVIVLGTDETKHDLTEEIPGQYQHISVLENIQQPNMNTLRKIMFIEPLEKNVESDAVDALVVATSMLIKHCKKLKYEKQIILMNAPGNYIKWHSIAQIQQTLLTQKISLVVIYLEQPLHTDIQINNKDYWEKLTKETGGESCLQTLEEAFDIANKFVKKNVKPTTTFRGVLRLGGSRLGEAEVETDPEIYMYLRTKPVNTMPAKQFSCLSDPTDESYGKVVTDRKYKLKYSKHLDTYPFYKNKSQLYEESGDSEDEYSNEKDVFDTKSTADEMFIDENKLLTIQYFGITPIPITKEQIISKDPCEEPAMFMLGYFPDSKFPVYYMSSSVYVVIGNTNHFESMTAISAIVHAMHETQSVALVRFVKQRTSAPKLGVLFPTIEGDASVLNYVEIPFTDDLPNIVKKPTKVAEEDIKKQDDSSQYQIPDDKMLESMEKLIESMDLMNADRDKNGNPCEYLHQEKVFNPMNWRLQQAIQDRAIDPQSSLPEFHPTFLKQHTLLPEFLENTKQWRDSIISLFSIQQVNKPQPFKKRTYGTAKDEDVIVEPLLKFDNINNSQEMYEPYNKKLRQDKMSSYEEDLALYANRDVNTITWLNPVEDFKAMVANTSQDLSKTAVQQMHAMILELASSSYGELWYNVVIDCLDALRVTALKKFYAKEFNQCLYDLKALCEPSNPQSGHLNFWKLMQSKNITLIKKEEAVDSEETETTANEFFLVNTMTEPANTDITDNIDQLLEDF